MPLLALLLGIVHLILAAVIYNLPDVISLHAAVTSAVLGLLCLALAWVARSRRPGPWSHLVLFVSAVFLGLTVMLAPMAGREELRKQPWERGIPPAYAATTALALAGFLLTFGAHRAYLSSGTPRP